MIDKKNILAVIPARGGSKSIPGKNVKKLGEHPLIAYSIAAGLQSQYVDRTIVTTDDETIASFAKEYGAEVPFMRPAYLAEDHVTDFPVFEHVLDWFDENERFQPDIIIQLRPTSPFRPIGSVDAAIEVMNRDEQADCVRAVTPSGENPFKTWFIEDGKMKPIMPSDFDEPYNMPRQKLPATFWQTGHIEVVRRNTIVNKKSLTGDSIKPYIIENKYAVDLDNLDQWRFAEFLMQKQDFKFIKP